jgi:hypothetical protein
VEMKSMKMDSQRPETAPMMEKEDAPRYPYGLQIHLDKETLEKLGIKELPEIGKEVAIAAVAKVCSVSESEHMYGSDKCMGLQITAMSVGQKQG